MLQKFKPYEPRPISKPKIYVVWLGHVIQIFTSKRGTSFRRSSKRCEDYDRKGVLFGQLPLFSTTDTPFTKDSASKASGTAGGGVRMCLHHDTVVDTFGEGCYVSQKEGNLIVALYNNTGKFSGFYRAIQWILSSRWPSSSDHFYPPK